MGGCYHLPGTGKLYGVAVRYPNELSVDDAITKLAINKAQVIYDFCAGKISKLNT